MLIGRMQIMWQERVGHAYIVNIYNKLANIEWTKFATCLQIIIDTLFYDGSMVLRHSHVILSFLKFRNYIESNGKYDENFDNNLKHINKYLYFCKYAIECNCTDYNNWLCNRKCCL